VLGETMRLLSLIALPFTIISSLFAASFVEDQTCAIIYGHEKTIVITKKDLERSHAMGKEESLQDIIDGWLIWNDAQQLKINAPDDAIEKYLVNLQKQNHMTAAQFTEALIHQGYPLEQFKGDLSRMYVVNGMIDFKIRSHIVIPREKIVEYYEQNPVMCPAAFKLRTGLIPFSKKLEKKVQQKNIINALKKGVSTKISWNNPFWIDEPDIAADKQFIVGLQVDNFHITEQSDGFLIYQVIEKKDTRPLSLEDRYMEITHILKSELEVSLLEDYKEELRKKAVIVYTQ
jgi:hypothetical protein